MKAKTAGAVWCLVAAACLSAERAFEPQPGKPLDPSLIAEVVIDEGAITQTLYVDPGNPVASDANDGLSVDSPMRTLGKAVVAALDLMEQTNAGARIFLRDGLHESPGQVTPFQNLTDAQKIHPLIIEGESRGGVVIDCTEAVKESAIADLGEGLFGFTWEEDRGLSSRPWMSGRDRAGTAIGHRSELIFVNGIRLDPVLIEPYDGEFVDGTLINWTYRPDLYVGRELIDKPGTFGVSEIEEDMIFFRPPEGVNMQEASVRVGVPGAVLDFRQKSNLVVRNLVISGAGAFHDLAMIRILGVNRGERVENILIEDVEFHSVACGTALSINDANNVTFRRIIARDCGGNGYAGTRIRNFLVEDVDMSQNNWLSRMAEIERWVAAGWKLLESEDMIVQRYFGSENGASGFWLDTEVSNVSVRQMYLLDNYVFGFYNEKNFGEILVEDSVFMKNRRYGFYFAETSNSTVRNCLNMANGEAPFAVRIYNPIRTQNDRLLVPQDNVVEGCLVTGVFPGTTTLYTYDGGGLSSDYRNSFVATFSGDQNRYWMPFFTRAFNIGTAADLDGWRAAILPGQELNSTFEDPGIDTSGNGMADFFLYENISGRELTALQEANHFNGFRPDWENRRPVATMPVNWRKGAGVEGFFVLTVPESGVYSFVLNSNCVAALHSGTGATLYTVSPEPLLESGTASTYQDWSDAGNGTTEMALEADVPYVFVIRAVLPDGDERPFLALGWNAPWMAEGEVLPVAAPYIRSLESLPVPLEGVLSAAGRQVNGRFSLDGFGGFWSLENNWIYHDIYRYLYVPVDQAFPGFWGYSLNLGWAYFNRASGTEFIYSSGLESWVYVMRVPDGTVFYYVFTGPARGWQVMI